MNCEECGLELKERNGHWVCFSCGLTAEVQVFERGESAYTDTNESLVQKYNREKKLIKRNSVISTITVYKDAHQVLKNYCKKNKKKMRIFLSELIMETCLE